MPLRIRLVVILMALVAIALAVILPITYTTTRSTLVSKLDTQLESSVPFWESYFQFLAGQGGGGVPSDLEGLVQPNTFALLLTSSGEVYPLPGHGLLGNPERVCHNCATPTITRGFLSEMADRASEGPRLLDLSSSGQSWRVFTKAIPFGIGGPLGSEAVIVIALPLSGVNSTMSHLLGEEILVAVGLMVAIALASWFLVRMGLRPLERMASTASDIAAGDLTQRVEEDDPRTEVGQLGAALNVMLGQIESAFREREASEDRLRRFIGDASHELRTPLTSIRGYAELFKHGDGGRPEDLGSALRRIESESVRMGVLVEDLLLLARLDQGRPLGHERVDMAQLADDAARDAGVVAPERSIRLITTGRCEVVGDELRLRQILANLVNNAMTYSPPGAPIEIAVVMDRAPVDITIQGVPVLSPLGLFGRRGRGPRPSGIAAEPVPSGALPTVRSFAPTYLPAPSVRPLGPDDLPVPAATGEPPALPVAVLDASSGKAANGGAIGNGSPPAPLDNLPTGQNPIVAGPDGGPYEESRVTVAVIDHGPGIPVEDAPHVFERFWRADQSRQRASGGAGLGLSIVASVVAAHRGRVSVRETPGGGATFVVELPAASPPPSSPPPSPPPPPPTA